MKKILLSFLFSVSVFFAFSQFSFTYNGREYHVLKTSKFFDAAGKEYDYNEMALFMMGGEYEILPMEPRDASKGYLMSAISREEQLKRAMAAPKPAESKSFKTGKKFDSFSGYDMNGNLIDTKSLKGKVMVLNFWFTTCPPCKQERPYLNKIAESYKGDPNVVFIAIALDRKEQLETYLRQNEFKYKVIPDGKKIADSYNVTAYPTQVIVDKDGKVAFSAVSYYYVTDYWMRKTIDELKEK